MPSRRQFLKNSSAAIVATTIPAVAFAGRVRTAESATRARLARSNDAVHSMDDPAFMALLDSALDAARAAGATYADVRVRIYDFEGWFWRGIEVHAPWIQREVGIGIRALYNGYWGYAAIAGAELTLENAAQLGREAAGQAKGGAKGRPRIVDLAPTPLVANGTWTTPIEIDPFTVPWDEKLDVIHGVMSYTARLKAGVQAGVDCTKEVQYFASSEGSHYKQTLYRIAPRLQIAADGGGEIRTAESVVSAVGAGWEYILNAPFERELPRLIAQSYDARSPIPTADVGRYDVVCDGVTLAKLADRQIGAATELDRAMGYLSNNEGTSYLKDPLTMLGTHRVGSTLLNVTSNRSMPKGAGTVQWDDEGVMPDEAIIVRDGILTDYQTTRESASWLADYYQKTGSPLRSHGGAFRGPISWAPQQGAPNLVIAPSRQDTSFETLCSGVKKGLAVLSGTSRTDASLLNAETNGEVVYEIHNGKLGNAVQGAVVLTRAPELWRNLIGLGGPQTVCPVGMNIARGRMAIGCYTVSAPAALFKDVAVTVNTARSV